MSTTTSGPFARSLSGYFETLLTPTGQQRKRVMAQPSAEERWRPASPQQQQQRRNFSGEQERGGSKDDQWRSIVTQIASDYTKLGHENKMLKLLCEEQEGRVKEIQDHIRLNLEGKENIDEVLNQLNLNSTLCRKCLESGSSQQSGQEEPSTDPCVAQDAAVNIVMLEIEERTKEFFMAQALELKLTGDMHQEEIVRLRQVAEGRQRADLNRVAAQEDECRGLQERLMKAEAAAAKAEAEKEEMLKKMEEEIEERRRLQTEAEKAKGDQDAHKRQLEKVVRDRQLLALKAEDLSARAVQMQRNYEVAAEQLERAEHKAEDERDKRTQLQRDLGVAQEKMQSLQADVELMKAQQKASQVQQRQFELDCRDLREKVQQAETEVEIVNEDRERLISLLRITVEAFQYHKGSIFKLDGMKDLCANLELELSEQMTTKEGSNTPTTDVSPAEAQESID